MKQTFIIHAKDSPIITFKVRTDEHYIVSVDDLTGEDINFEFYKKLDEFEERYFQIDPWYWFSGFETQ